MPMQSPASDISVAVSDVGLINKTEKNAIGNRPIDIHLDGLKKLGATFEIENGFVIGRV